MKNVRIKGISRLLRSGVRAHFVCDVSKSADSSGIFLKRTSAEYRLKRKGTNKDRSNWEGYKTERVNFRGTNVQDGVRARSLDIGLLPAIRFARTVLAINIHELRGCRSLAVFRLRSSSRLYINAALQYIFINYIQNILLLNIHGSSKINTGPPRRVSSLIFNRHDLIYCHTTRPHANQHRN